MLTMWKTPSFNATAVMASVHPKERIVYSRLVLKAKALRETARLPDTRQ
jgi:hypothetical protein